MQTYVERATKQNQSLGCIYGFEIQAYIPVISSPLAFYLHLRKNRSMILSNFFTSFSKRTQMIWAWKLWILSHRWYFGHHNGKWEILKAFSAGMTSNLQNTLFNMCTGRKYLKIQIHKYTPVVDFTWWLHNYT